MTIKMQLWLKGQIFVEEEFRAPDFDPDWTYQQNVEYREEFTKLMGRKMCNTYQPQIERCDGYYSIACIIESRIHHQPLDQEFNYLK